jgi:hypothetical protein
LPLGRFAKQGSKLIFEVHSLAAQVGHVVITEGFNIDFGPVNLSVEAVILLGQFAEMGV